MSLGCLHAQNMKTVFVSMPDSILPLLTKVNREDCVDFLDSKMKAVVKNRFGKDVELKQLTEDYLQMQTSSCSEMEMKLLPLNDTVKVICMVNTVCASACDSRIDFFTLQWQPLSKDKFITLPADTAFYLSAHPADDKEIEIRKKADLCLVKMEMADSTSLLQMQYTTPNYLNKEDKEMILPYLKKEKLVYEWKDARFSRTK